jgi:hypothetical protein
MLILIELITYLSLLILILIKYSGFEFMVLGLMLMIMGNLIVIKLNLEK